MKSKVDMWLSMGVAALVCGIGYAIYEAKLNDDQIHCFGVPQEYKSCNEWGESKIRQMCEAAATTKAMGCYGVTPDSL